MAIAELLDLGSERQTWTREQGYDRRRSEREPKCERAMLAASSEDGFQRLLGVELLDISAEGYGVFCTEHIPTGEPCTIFRDELHPGRTSGVVARVAETDGGYILGISTCDLLAA